MDKFLFFLFIFLFSVLEKTILKGFLIFGAGPDIVLLMVICQGLNTTSRQAVLIGFVSGIIKGLTQPELFGIYLLSYTFVGFSAGIVTEGVYRDKIWVPLIVTFFISAINVLFLIWFLGIFRYIGNFSLYKAQFFSVFYNTILILPVYYFYEGFIFTARRPRV